MSLNLGDMKALALDYADVTDDPFIDSVLFAKQANIELGKLFDVIIASDECWRVESHSFAITPQLLSYKLPSDYYKALKVYYIDNIGAQRPMRRVPLDEVRFSAAGGILASYYGTVVMPYVPKFLPLTDDADAVFPEVPDSWVDHAILGLAIRIRVKEESDIAALQMLQKDVRDQIVTMAQARDLGEPSAISDYYRSHGGGYRSRRSDSSDSAYLDRAGARYAIIGNNLVLG